MDLFHHNPALTISLALAAGLFAQVLAHHLKLPGIVLLLAAGALLGPDVLGIVQPQSLDGGLERLVGFAVAVILFEGGMNLNISRLRRESVTIRQLITVGAVVTALGSTLAARLIMAWNWNLAILFGVLVIVTGPTVVTPLLRRIKVNKNLETVLEAEGVLIDPIGAILAVVALEVVIHPTGESFASGLLDIVLRLGGGAIVGFGGGLMLALLLRPRWLIPDGLVNIFALSMVLALFHLSDAVLEESGIATVTVAGVVVGNVRTRVQGDLLEFKEQLTIMLIGLLFVLLAADVRFHEIQALGVPGLMTCIVLMLLVRPLNVAAGTVGSDFSLKEKAFLAWLAPRGIVAAAVASFFATALQNAGIEGGGTLRAMVFLVIAVTVLVEGALAGVVARLLGVRRQSNKGYAILGVNELSLALGRAMRDGDEEVLFLDSNPDASHAAEQGGFRVVFGNALEERTLLRAGIESLAGCIGLTPNEEVNYLFATRARKEYKVPRCYVALHLDEGHVTDDMILEAGSHVLFGAHWDTDLWAVRLRRGIAAVERWRLVKKNREEANDKSENGGEGAAEGKGSSDPRTESGGEESELLGVENVLLPLVLYRGKETLPFDERIRIKDGDEVAFAVFEEQRAAALGWLDAGGWERVVASGQDVDPEP